MIPVSALQSVIAQGPNVGRASGNGIDASSGSVVDVSQPDFNRNIAVAPQPSNSCRVEETVECRDPNRRVMVDNGATNGYFEGNANRPPTNPAVLNPLPLDGIPQQPHWGMVYHPGVMPVPAADPSSMIGMVPLNFNQFGFMAPTEHTLPPIPPMMPMIHPRPTKEIVHFKSCTLFPPNPNAPSPTTRERPPGCRTVFLGGLPENITEEIVREVFENCGEITTIRMSKKNFCHIRFENESFVDNALYFSGYRIRLGSNTDPPNVGRLHVDYAQARDDLYEWECRQRQIQREHRHREKMQQERLQPPSPPPVVHYSEHESSLLAEKLKVATSGGNKDDGFQKSVHTLIIWLERGDCSKKNACQFYSMIQSANNRVRHLMNDKVQYEEELLKAKELMKERMRGILIEFNQIEKVFLAASRQKVTDHFTKGQRKNIDMWKKQAQEIKNAQLEDILSERVEDDMECSDEDSEYPVKKLKTGESGSESQTGQINNLKEENDNLHCQLEAYKNEVDVMMTEGVKEVEEKNKQILTLQQALQGVQQQLIQITQQRQKDEETIRSLKNNIDLDGAKKDSEENVPSSSVSASKTYSGNIIQITDKEARLIGLLSTFLNVHPFGASVDYIWSYVHCLDSTIKSSDVENLLLKFPSIFKQEFTGVGASLERKWRFIGFDCQLT
ncbi:hypothetical protein CHUAL_008527 [Chamberlinius hualienensis]